MPNTLILRNCLRRARISASSASQELLKFAVLPDGARPGLAAGYNCGTLPGDWMWIKYQVNEHLSGPEWASLAVLGSIIDSFSLVLRRIAGCRGPLHISPSATCDLYELRNFLRGRRPGAARV